ncbi:DUF4333 domain-containing protein [Aldersonia kunmingensis]|uniref:DUF4333 domain-containing protein n=1 Tax=Aldersonia kunmingensis TaxID=408066 RepID=UPI000ABEC70C|nr:DUF4333 domain-containing protein [Aldersonia kunmingensis]
MRATTSTSRSRRWTRTDNVKFDIESYQTVGKDVVAEQVSTQLTEQIGTTPDSVDCPEDLDAKVGATLTCTLTHEGVSYDVDVTVTSVDGGDVKFDIQVADQPK